MAELTPKVISELPDSSVPQNADLFAISRSGTSRKISWETLKSGLPQIGNLKSTQGTIAGGSSGDIEATNGVDGFLLVGSAADNKKDIIIYHATSAGAVSYVRLTDAGGITISTSTNTLTLTVASGATVAYINLYY